MIEILFKILDFKLMILEVRLLILFELLQCNKFWFRSLFWLNESVTQSHASSLIIISILLDAFLELGKNIVSLLK